MQTVSRIQFTTVKTEGAILPADLLHRVADGHELDGLAPTDYHLSPNERLNEAVNRAWNRCLGVWQGFDDQRIRLPSTDSGTTLTRERWLLILFQELGYGRLPYQGSLSIGPDGDAPRYPISHRWSHAPIHLITFRQDLDRRDLSSKRSPHSLMQEFLNRSDESLWGFLSNGLRLRVLRDNVSLTRAAYVEFDLEAMMNGELYADFSLLWLVCHQSRVEGTPPGECWLERWSREAAAQGTRALDALRDGVQEAIAALGRGFLAHPANRDLKAALKSGGLNAQDYYRQLLRLVYRLIFLFVAEDRDLLLLPGTPAEAQRRYTEFYSVRRLRDLAEVQRGGPHPDLYRCLRRVFALLREGYEPLGLPGLGSFLFSERSTPALDGADLANCDLLDAVRALAFTVEGRVRRSVDYKNLGAEELGSVYESLLELHPQLNADAGTFELGVAAGSERKTTGSYYTPSSLIHCLLDSALEPVIEDRLRNATADRRPPSAVSGPSSVLNPQEEAILSIKVVDPACGSGHFLIAAAHRLARHLARARTGDDEPAPAELRAALRDVARRCIHGVDINPMAVELCKVALWMETLDPGKPLSFLERNIRCGNSLIGTTPALLDEGIPDEAFKPITGDDRAYCREWRKRNKKERGQPSLFTYESQPWDRLGNLAAGMMSLDAVGDDTLDGVRRQQEMYESLVRSADYRYGRLWADAWCAAFVWKKTEEFAYPITEEAFRRVERNPFDLPKWMENEIERLREQYQFFHWHLAFPHVFSVPAVGEEAENEQTGWNRGFDVVLGNPPWEKVKLQEKEWFATRSPEIAAAPKASQRRKMIASLAKENPTLHAAFLEARRNADGVSHFVRNGGRYPLCSRGDVNTYAVFAELAYTLQRLIGQVGVIVPSGIATDDTSKYFFRNLVNSRTLVSLYDFENTAPLFVGVHRSYKFCLLTLTGLNHPVGSGADLIFFAQRVADLQDKDRRLTLSAEEIALLNPNTGTCPIFRNKRTAELNKGIYRRIPVLLNKSADQNPWGITFIRMFDMTNDSALLRTREQLETDGAHLKGNIFYQDDQRWMPVFEGKMVGIYDHRASSIELNPENVLRQQQSIHSSLENHLNPSFVNMPYLWGPEAEGRSRTPESWKHQWLPVFKRVTAATNERTIVGCVIPWTTVSYTLYVVVCSPRHQDKLLCLMGNFWSFIGDCVVRQKTAQPSLPMGVVYESAFLPPDIFTSPSPWQIGDSLNSWITKRVLELTYTAWDLQPFAQDCGYDGPPFRWDEERRFLLRCELDAAYFHLYSIAHDDVAYIMDTFPIVKRKDEAAHGEYRTKRVILEIYDAMQQAIETGQPYQTRLDPPPADPRVAHPPRG